MTATATADVKRDLPEANRALAALTRAAGLDHGLAELVKVRASQINGCAYCVDLHTRAALRAGEDPRRLSLLCVWRDSPVFDDRERAALAVTEALTLMSRGGVDETLEAAAAQFPGDGLSRLVTVVTAINAWNRVMVAAGNRPPATI